MPLTYFLAWLFLTLKIIKIQLGGRENNNNNFPNIHSISLMCSRIARIKYNWECNDHKIKKKEI